MGTVCRTRSSRARENGSICDGKSHSETSRSRAVEHREVVRSSHLSVAAVDRRGHGGARESQCVG